MREKIIKMIEEGISLKEISECTGSSYNTVRQISVSINLLKKLTYLNKNQIEKLKDIGNNIRALSPIKDDEEAIVTIVDYIDKNTTRNDIEELVRDIREVKERKNNLVSQYNFKIMNITKELDDVKNKIKELRDLDEIKNYLDSQFKYIRDIKDKDIKKGYLNLVALKYYDNGLFYALAKRVNINLWNKLRRAEAIIPGTNEIIDMKKFVDLTINTIKRNNYYRDDHKEKYIIEIKHMTIENQIKPYLLDLDNEIIEYTNKINEIKEEMKKASKAAIENYFEEREFRNNFTKKDSLTHAKIQHGGAKWLFNNDCIATIELHKDKYQFDVIAYNKNDEIIILEAKVSTNDLRSDQKISKYMNYCDKLYIISNNEYVCNIAKDEVDDLIGIIRLNKQYGFYEIVRDATFIGNGDKNLIEDINKKNSRYLLFGM